MGEMGAQGDAVEDEERRYVVRKADLLGSKLFRALFGGAQRWLSMEEATGADCELCQR